MADDTRLAEACLLLNYSHQSYREQMLMAKQQQSQQSDAGDDRRHETTLLDNNNCDQLNEKNVSSKLITPPPEHDYVVESQEGPAFTGSHCFESPPGSEVTLPCNSTDEKLKLEDSSHQLFPGADQNTGKTLSNHGNNYCDSAMEPINNLLAAVNCALPGLRSRPTILQRNSMTQIQSCETISPPTNHVPDHDYCHQEQDATQTHKACDLPRMIERSPLIYGVNNLDGTRNNLTNSRIKQEHSKSFANFNRPLKLVAVHLGAGNSYHDEESLNLAKRICEQVMLQDSAQLLLASSKKRRKNALNQQDQVNTENQLQPNSDKITAELAVVHLVKLMEDHQSLNCGYGSNLNIKGQVECDASLMSDETQMWAGVGAVSGCRNPILLAKSLYDHRNVPRPLDLVQPNLLVASGAKQWMRERCPYLTVMDSKMVSSKAFSTYQKLKSKYDAVIRMTTPHYHGGDSVAGGLTGRYESNTKRMNYGLKKLSIRHPHYDHCPGDYTSSSSSTNLDHGFYCVNEHASRINVRESTSSTKLPSIRREFSDEEIQDGQAHSNTEPTSQNSRVGAPGNQTLKIEKDINKNHRLDTVGAIAVDINNNFASAISSGGILLKCKGRVGQAAVPGAGCWSEDSVAVTTTGVGEYLTLSMFAKKFHDKVQTLRLLYDLGHVEKKPDLSDMINNGIEECFEDLTNSAALAHVDPKERLAGMLAVSSLNSKSSPDRVDTKDLYLSYAHNTTSMCIGHMTCDDIVGHSVMSRQDIVPESVANEERMHEPIVRTVKFSLNTGGSG